MPVTSFLSLSFKSHDHDETDPRGSTCCLTFQVSIAFWYSLWVSCKFPSLTLLLTWNLQNLIYNFFDPSPLCHYINFLLSFSIWEKWFIIFSRLRHPISSMFFLRPRKIRSLQVPSGGIHFFFLTTGTTVLISAQYSRLRKQVLILLLL